MKNRPSCSLLISTYNWPEALAIVLKSVERQSLLPDEILIADDGSKEATRALIESFQSRFSIPVRHFWHPDDGFRRTVILNKAVAGAKGDYIVQVDGDVMLHPNFIEDHRGFIEEHSFVAGTRTMLGKELSKQVIEQEMLTIPLFTKGVKNFFNSIRIAFLKALMSNRYKVSAKNAYYVKGCNMAFWRKDFIAVNGYNESITGWGKEDSEFAIRLYNAGVKKRYLKFGAVVYHLWHQEFSRDRESLNIELMDKTMKEKLVRCDKGVDQYL